MRTIFANNSSALQTIKINELLGPNEYYFTVADIFETILPKEVIINGHRGDLMVTHQDITYFNISPGNIINVLHTEYILPNNNIFDACIKMLEYLNSDKNIEMKYGY